MPRSSKGHFIPGPSTQPPTPPSDHRPGFDAHVNLSKGTDHGKSVTSAVTRSPDIFPFMELPPELRNHIYEIVIEDIRTTENDAVGIIFCLRNEWPCRDDDLFRYVEDTFDGNNASWREYWRIERSRTNFLYCHLNKLSRTIRQEFVPMLWSRMHVRYCLCIHGTDDYYSPCPISLDLLRGNIAYITWDMDLLCERDIDWDDEPLRTRMEFVEFLKNVDFKGTINLVGHRAHVKSFRQALESIAAAENTEHARHVAMQRVKQIDESYDQLVKRHCLLTKQYLVLINADHFVGNNSGTDDVRVKFDINLRESRYEDDTT